MRIWSIHPKYLDAKGLVALWREALLAKHVLERKTKGYKHHPQLLRFKNSSRPLAAINLYLQSVYKEAMKRGYQFDASKFKRTSSRITLTVTNGQIKYEFSHLLKKLKKRDKNKFRMVKEIRTIQPHPLFKIVKGNIEEWEIVQ